ncbi:hypothetical protein, partial [Escherichia coli]|uniref:hypothetical protein n=1 Tax=Escherichia coli TaxID=562 RepID=UPI0014121AE0
PGGEGNSSTSRVLAQVGGYIDLHYIQPQPQQGQWGTILPSNCYLPEFVITNQNLETNAVTPELCLLGLASTRLLQNNNAWQNTYRPRHVKND